jgi:predicted Abi (CAAX) family protease
VFRVGFRRIALALATRPTVRAWIIAGVAGGAFAVTAVPFGFASGLFAFSLPDSWTRLAVFALVAVVIPGLGEEVIFRALILPHPTEKCSPRFPAVVGVLVFVAWHPLNAALFFPQVWPLFTDWRFLTLAGWLGICLTVVYTRGGSVWPCVAVHWLVAVVWNGCLGGPLKVLTGGESQP